MIGGGLGGGARGGSPTATIKIAAQAADVPEGQTGWIVLAEAILPGYVPPAGRTVSLTGDEGGGTSALISTTATAPPGTYVDWFTAYFEVPFAIIDPELVSVAISGGGNVIATITDSGSARATTPQGMGGSTFAVQLTMVTPGAHLADLTAGTLEATIYAVTYGPTL